MDDAGFSNSFLPSCQPGKSFVLVVLILITFMATAPVRLSADTAQNLFKRANKQLKTGYYEEALNLYHTIEQRDTVSGALYLNMGITYARIDSLGKAKYYLLKARSFPSTRDPAEQGLQYVNNQFSNKSAVLPKLPWERAIDWLHKRWGTSGTFAVGYFILMLAIGGILYSWFFNRYRKYIYQTARILSIAGILCILLSIYINYIEVRYARAVMTRQETVVKQQPASDGAPVSQAYEGYTFTVDLQKSRMHDHWYYVRLPNGMHGWIQKNNIKIL